MPQIKNKSPFKRVQYQSTEPDEMRLYDDQGNRLYLNTSERQAFVKEAHQLPPLERVFCLMLAYTGCRISEARNLRKSDLQLTENKVSIRTLKRRNGQPVREVPIPATFSLVLQEILEAKNAPAGDYVWGSWQKRDRPPARITCYRLVKRVMKNAGITGPKAAPKGLRHTFGVHAILQGIQLHILQKWMGHASMRTTAIYATVLGLEEQILARKMWGQGC